MQPTKQCKVSMSNPSSNQISPIGLDKPYGQAVEVSLTALGDDVIMMHLGNGYIRGLNRTAQIIWNSFKTPNSINKVIAALMLRFDVDEQTCRAEVEAVTRDLLAAGLLQAVEGDS